MTDTQLYAEYANKIFSGDRNYSLNKARKLFGKNYNKFLSVYYKLLEFRKYAVNFKNGDLNSGFNMLETFTILSYSLSLSMLKDVSLNPAVEITTENVAITVHGKATHVSMFDILKAALATFRNQSLENNTNDQEAADVIVNALENKAGTSKRHYVSIVNLNNNNQQKTLFWNINGKHLTRMKPTNVVNYTQQVAVKPQDAANNILLKTIATTVETN